MRQFIVGAIVGAVLMGVGVEAGNLYDKNGKVQAPAGSQQQYDYFRQRQQYLDTQAIRRQMEQDRTSINSPTRSYRSPCDK